jgi:hypothetical protein
MCLSFQATREPEIRRIVPPGQPGKNGEDLISIEKKKKTGCGGAFLSSQLQREA